MPNFHLPNFMICPSFDERFSHQLCRKCLQRKTPCADPISDRRIWAPCPACWVEAPLLSPLLYSSLKGQLKDVVPAVSSREGRRQSRARSVAGMMRGGEGVQGPGLAG